MSKYNNRFTWGGERLVHADDYAEGEMTVCGIYCDAQDDPEGTIDAVTCPSCIRGLQYYKTIRISKKAGGVK